MKKLVTCDLIELTDEQAALLSEHEGDLHFNNLTELSESAARYLAHKPGIIVFKKIKKISIL
jgi:hypothetical protein